MIERCSNRRHVPINEYWRASVIGGSVSKFPVIVVSRGPKASVGLDVKAMSSGGNGRNILIDQDGRTSIGDGSVAQLTVLIPSRYPHASIGFED